MLDKYKKLENPHMDVETTTDMSKPNLQALLKTTEETRMALEKVANKKIKKSGVKNLINIFRFLKVIIYQIQVKPSTSATLPINKD